MTTGGTGKLCAAARIARASRSVCVGSGNHSYKTENSRRLRRSVKIVIVYDDDFGFDFEIIEKDVQRLSTWDVA